MVDMQHNQSEIIAAARIEELRYAQVISDIDGVIGCELQNHQGDMLLVVYARPEHHFARVRAAVRDRIGYDVLLVVKAQQQETERRATAEPND